MAVTIVYATAANRDEALRIGRLCVSERLAACANVIGNMRSIYWWKDKLEEGDEAVLILKTARARVPDLIARVKALHSYDVPCIEAIDVADGNPDFLAWVEAETTGQG
jgi:periplasmic divalent cation tolerance protein